MDFSYLMEDRLAHHSFRGLLNLHCTFRPACLLNHLCNPLTQKCFNLCRHLHKSLKSLLAGMTVVRWVLHTSEKTPSTAHQIRVLALARMSILKRVRGLAVPILRPMRRASPKLNAAPCRISRIKISRLSWT